MTNNEIASKVRVGGQVEGLVIGGLELGDGSTVDLEVGCGHADAYWQVDAYRADVHDDDSLYLICDHCNDEGAADI